MIDKIMEEFEKQGIIWDVLGIGAYKLALDQFTNGSKSRDEEINKLKSIAEEYQESYVQIERENKELIDALEDIIIEPVFIKAKKIAIEALKDGE